ncbi:hypothetical protein PUN28_000581 [Cardiocondyla obscurior]|uniref:Uncharacterized protein n=1 Tax=Cardiocondyla obscurior TaxID=286306 RepID=A0AAW2H053_9HYME
MNLKDGHCSLELKPNSESRLPRVQILRFVRVKPALRLPSDRREGQSYTLSVLLFRGVAGSYRKSAKE